MENNKAMNLYIINKVLWDYTEGMAVIAAESIDRAGEIFANNDKFFSFLYEFDAAVANGHCKVIEGVNHSEGVVAYVYGGG